MRASRWLIAACQDTPHDHPPNCFACTLRDYSTAPSSFGHGAEDAVGYRFLSEAIKSGCRLAIKLSERI